MGAIYCHGNQSLNPIWPKTYAVFPHPNNASDKIQLHLIHWSQIYLCLKV